MKRVILIWATLLVFLVCTAPSVKAQGPDAFAIGTGLSGSGYHLPADLRPAPCNPYGNADCSVQTTWEEPCPAGLNCGGGTYSCPEVACGSIELSAQSGRAGMFIPRYLGFPNGGALPNDCTLTYSSINFNLRPDGTMSDGSKVGDTWYFTGTTGSSCTGYAQGVTFSITTNWTTTAVTTYLGRPVYHYKLTGGSGTVTGPNQAKVIPRCGSLGKPCPGFGG